MARQFTLFTRKRKNLPPLFYAYIKQADGSRGKPVNTGHTLKEAAVKWCEEEISRRETDRIRAELETERAALAAERKAFVIQKESQIARLNLLQIGQPTGQVAEQITAEAFLFRPGIA